MDDKLEITGIDGQDELAVARGRGRHELNRVGLRQDLFARQRPETHEKLSEIKTNNTLFHVISVCLPLACYRFLNFQEATVRIPASATSNRLRPLILSYEGN